jgi:hypothetical protein
VRDVDMKGSARVMTLALNFLPFPTCLKRHILTIFLLAERGDGPCIAWYFWQL